MPTNRPARRRGESWKTAAVPRVSIQMGSCQAEDAACSPARSHSRRPGIGRPVLVHRNPLPAVPHPPGAVGPEEPDPRDLGSGREDAEHEGVEPRFVPEVEPTVGDQGGDPARLLGDRLEAGAESPLQGVEHGPGTLLDEGPGALGGAPEPEPEDHSGRERDQGAEPEDATAVTGTRQRLRGVARAASAIGPALLDSARPGSSRVRRGAAHVRSPARSSWPGSAPRRRSPAPLLRTGGGRGSSP